MAIVHFGIGEIGAGNSAAWEGSLPHLLLHGSFGCFAMDRMGGDCAAGFFAAVSHEWAKKWDGSENDEERARFAHLLGGLVGFLFADGNATNVGFAAQIAKSAFENNYLRHEELEAYRRALRTCEGLSGRPLNGCIYGVYRAGGFEAASNEKLAAMRRCIELHDSECIAEHIKEINDAQSLADEIRDYWVSNGAGHNELNPVMFSALNTNFSGLEEALNYRSTSIYMAARRAELCPELTERECNARVIADSEERFHNTVKNVAVDAVLILSGGLAIRLGVGLVPNLRNCVANPICRQELQISGGEMLLGATGATAGQTFYVAGGAAITGRVALSQGDRVLEVFDDVAGVWRKTTTGYIDDAGRLFVDGTNGRGYFQSGGFFTDSANAPNGGVPSGVSFGRNANQDHHVWRHIEQELGMSRQRVRDAVVADLPPAGNLSGGLHVRFVTVDGVRLQYNAFKLPDGTVNIGRIHEAN